MNSGYRKIVPMVAGMVLLGATGFAQSRKIAAYFSGNGFPRAQIKTEAVDAEIVERLKLPAVLAVLKFELSREENFAELSAGERGQLIASLDDANLVLEYTGKQERMALTRGGQAIDGNLARFDQAAFFVSGGPRPAYETAQIILHELGHIWQLRHGWGTRIIWKEERPEYLETNLPAANFTDDVLDQVAGLMAGENGDEEPTRWDPGAVAWEGTWEVTSHWTQPASMASKPTTWRFTVEVFEGGRCRIRAGSNEFDGTIENGTLNWKDPGLGIHKFVNYSFWRLGDGDELSGKFKGKDRANRDIEGKYEGKRVE